MRPISRATANVLGGIGLLLLLISPAKAAKDRKETGDEIFAATNVLRIKIEIPKEGIDKLRGHGFTWMRGAAGRERPEVLATIREGGHVYTNVACHLKGSAGSFQPIDSKPSFTLNFDKHVKNRTFHGLEKISLNNSVQDPSYISEKISRELFNAAGVPAPRADYATVELNGRKLGLYVLLEGYNRQFLKRHFKSAKGNLYDGGFLRDLDSELATNAGDDNADHSDLLDLADAANEPEATNRVVLLHKTLDFDRFITFMAMEVMICHWDGYSMNKNNYRIYHDPNAGMVFMPHGMDQMFGTMMVNPAMGVKPPLQGIVAKAVMGTSEGRRRYFERLTELNQKVFDVESITNRVYEAAARLAPVLAEISEATAANHRRDVEDIVDRIVQRKQSLSEQLAGAQGKILDFDGEGVAPLSGWTTLTNAGRPLLLVSASNGVPVLYIGAAQGTSVASWRTKVLLEEGHYSFEGRMQTKAVAADPRDRRAGAGLRVYLQTYGVPALHKTLGDSNWREVSFDFVVPDGLHDIDLVCELRASQGEVWFDASSLRLVRKD